MITNHRQLLNWLIEKYKFKSYLEVGVQSTKQNFDKIKCASKRGVDPAVKSIPNVIFQQTSDDFFNDLFSLTNLKFDCIFLDGLHHAEQVQRDFENSLKCLNEGGRIVIHDCLPEDESTTHVPRDSKCWHGDVYKFAMKLYDTGLDYYTVNMDNGCTVIWKNPNGVMPRLGIIGDTWDYYIKNRGWLLHIIQPSEIETYL